MNGLGLGGSVVHELVIAGTDITNWSSWKLFVRELPMLELEHGTYRKWSKYQLEG